VSLNSERDTGATGGQVAWLRADLAATNADCVLAYWHKPRWTAGNYTDLVEAQQLWNVLYDGGADVVLAGHDHNYQRYPRMNNSGSRDADRGIRSFVVGTGGRHLYPLRADARREAGNDSAWGVLELTLHSSSFSWRFLAVAGSTFTDSGSDSCSPSSAPSPPPPPPTPPTPAPPAPQPPPSPPPPPPPVLPPAAPQPPGSPPSSPSPPSPGPPPAPRSTTSPPPAPSVAPGTMTRIRLGRGPIRVSASGRGRIWLACPKGAHCSGRLTLYGLSDLRSPAALPRRGQPAGSGSFAVRAGSARPVTLTVRARWLRRLAQRGTLRGTVLATLADGRPAASKTVKLVPLRPKRR
jgi:Calcineurin-like phosphoesterase